MSHFGKGADPNPLTNASAPNNTSGITIYNHDDSGTNHDNYVQIAAADVGGSLPAPVKVELTNNTGGSLNYKQIWLANNAFCDPANFPHILEGEAFVAGGGTTASNADSSSSSYATITTAENYQQWTLSSALLTKARGYDFHLMALSVSQRHDLHSPIGYGIDRSIHPVARQRNAGRLLSDAIIDPGRHPFCPAATVRRMGRSVCSSTTGPPVH